MENWLDRAQPHDPFGAITDYTVVGILLVLLIAVFVVFTIQNKKGVSTKRKVITISGLILLIVIISTPLYIGLEKVIYPKDRLTTYIQAITKKSVIYTDYFTLENHKPKLSDLSINIENHMLIEELKKSTLVSSSSEAEKLKETFENMEGFYNLAPRNVTNTYESRIFMIDFILEPTLSVFRLHTTDGVFFFKTTLEFKNLFQQELKNPKPRKLK